MCKSNAAQKLTEQSVGKNKSAEALEELGIMLGMVEVPKYIEAYDISHTGGSDNVAGMVVYEDGKAKKSEFKRFRIEGLADQDDYASMAEAVERRFERAKSGDEGFEALPNLLLLDGGKGHVSVIKETLAKMHIDIPVFGMAKDDYHNTRTLCTETEEISIAKEKAVYMLIYKIQEEVHRFTISKMRASKEKSLKKSVLEEIDGIGKEKAKALLAHFKSLSALKKASLDEIKLVKGISEKNAEKVFMYFSKDKDELRSLYNSHTRDSRWLISLADNINTPVDILKQLKDIAEIKNSYKIRKKAKETLRFVEKYS
jgi:excinuclease ABC subunit C